ncbi:MAG: hypothetical protein AAGB24_06445 [Bacteroidota bacterium]
MTYKTKSLIYLSCFVIAAFIYDGTIQENDFENEIITTPELSDNQLEDDADKLVAEVSELQE